MNAITRIFTPKPATRQAVPLFIGIIGPSSSGKTFSALRLATGIQAVTGGDIHMIDTENRRGLHYADRFKYQHIQFDPPFGSLDYLAALEQSAAAGAKIIIVDSASHEHESTGGLLDLQDQEMRRLAGDDYGTYKAERFNMIAWQKPKFNRRKLIGGMVRLNASVIFCFRAKETSKPIKKDGKTQIVPMGFSSIGADEWVFEMALSTLLLPGSNGVPTWRSDNPGEKIAIKLPEQFRNIFADSQPLSEDIGKKLAEWAKGEPAPAATIRQPSAATLDFARTAARGGSDVFATWWKGATKDERSDATTIIDELKKSRAEAYEPAHDPQTAELQEMSAADAFGQGTEARAAGLSRDVPGGILEAGEKFVDAWLQGWDSEDETMKGQKP